MGKVDNQQFRPTQAVINLAAVQKNLKLAADISGAPVMAIVKANAYGLGIEEVAKTIHNMQECEFFGIAFTEEGVVLRDILTKLGCEKKILNLEGFFSTSGMEQHIKHNIDTTIHHPEQIEMLKKHNIANQATAEQPLRVWFKCNSGMNRLGLNRQQTLDAYDWISKQANIKLVGMMTHFSSANRGEPTVSMLQMAHFHETLKTIWPILKDKVMGSGDEMPLISICNSPGIMAGFAQEPFSNIPELDALDPQPKFISRPGLMLYGCSPMDDDTAEDLDIAPVMTLKTKLMSVRELTAGESVGYEDRTWIASNSCLMGVAPIGYADGYPFVHPDKITQLPLLVKGKRCSLGGRVSMDMLCIDLSNCPDAKVGDEVELWGDNLPANKIAEIAGGPPQRLLAALTKRVPRIYKKQS